MSFATCGLCTMFVVVVGLCFMIVCGVGDCTFCGRMEAILIWKFAYHISVVNDLNTTSCVLYGFEFHCVEP